MSTPPPTPGYDPAAAAAMPTNGTDSPPSPPPQVVYAAPAPAPTDSKPFYQQTWFYVCIALLIALTVFFLGMYTGTKIEKQLIYRRFGEKALADGGNVGLLLGDV